LLLDKARQFAGQYIDSLEERPVFPGEKSLRAMDARKANHQWTRIDTNFRQG
jgi:hypothetical protein